MQTPRIGLVAFGEVGTGKSTLCNTLIGSNGEAFTESDKTEAQTFETIGKEGLFGNQQTFLIDTPGLGDAERNDAAHLVQMAQYIKDNDLIKGFIMTINVHCPRLGDRERRLFELISSMYPGSPWFKHIQLYGPDVIVLWLTKLSNGNRKEKRDSKDLLKNILLMK